MQMLSMGDRECALGAKRFALIPKQLQEILRRDKKFDQPSAIRNRKLHKLIQKDKKFALGAKKFAI